MTENHAWNAFMCALAGLVIAGACGTPARAGELVLQNNWAALASDRTAATTGDSLTVLIQEASQATDTSRKGAQGDGNLLGSYSMGSDNGSAQLGVSGGYTINGQNLRAGQMVAQISVVVDGILPNGDLHVTGDQLINLNGRKTQIHLAGRVRRADISSSNTVFSASLADATIVYGKPGLTADGKPGLWNRMSSWFKP